MMRRRRFLALATALGFCLVLGIALQPWFPWVNAAETTLLVSAAASLEEALVVVQANFEAEYSDIAVNYNFGSSGALQQQIEQGAPVDVFISAGVPQMDALAEKDLLLPNTRASLLGNRLVLITPNDSTLGLTDFSDLTQGGVERISVGEFRSVPAGQYAEQVLSNLSILTEIRPKLIFANSARGAIAAVESGNVEAGLVYATDAAISAQVTVVATAAKDLHAPIIYPVAIMNHTASPDAARAFVDYLFSGAAGAVFENFGFPLLD